MRCSFPNSSQLDSVRPLKILEGTASGDKLRSFHPSFRGQSDEWFDNEILFIRDRGPIFQRPWKVQHDETWKMAIRVFNEAQKGIVIADQEVKGESITELRPPIFLAHENIESSFAKPYTNSILSPRIGIYRIYLIQICIYSISENLAGVFEIQFAVLFGDFCLKCYHLFLDLVNLRSEHFPLPKACLDAVELLEAALGSRPVSMS